MSPRRSWRFDAAAFVLFLVGLVVAVAVFGVDPGSLRAGDHLLGPAGAWLGQSLLEALGLAVYVLLASWFVLVVLLLLRQSWGLWTFRLAGWLILLPCAAVLADWADWYRSGAARTGQGGALGTWLALRLNEELRPMGQGILVGAAVLLGLLLGADFVLVRLWQASRQILGGIGKICSTLRRRLARPSGTTVITEADRDEGPAKIEPRPIRAAAGPDSIPIHHHNGGLPISRGEKAQVDPRGGDNERFADYQLPPLTVLEDAQPISYTDQDKILRDRATLLEKTFTDFGLNVNVVGINTGPVITQFEVALETGLRVHKVTRLADDIALNLKVPSVRFVAPIPGKNAVGVEVPNELRAVVRLKEVMLTAGKKAQQSKIPLFLGKDSEGRPLVFDLAEMPHLLIAGSTGTGKSVCMNAIILSMLMTRRPDELKMIMIDPKVVELSEYGKVPHLMHPVFSDMKKAEAVLAWAVEKIEESYALLGRARVRNIAGFNALDPEEIQRRMGPVEGEESEVPTRLPYIVIFIDEMADLMMMLKKEVEGHIIRLSQKSRAAGIHLVVATQKPTVDVITGLIKSNLPARVCFKVTNKSDSRVVLDEMGADKLLGKGDMLFLPPGTSQLVRAQGTYASDEEISRVVGLMETEPCFAEELMQLNAATREGGASLQERLRERDEMYEPAIEVILREGRGSVSLLQRSLGIGYGRAARLIDFMAEDGIVGAYNGSNAREVLYTPEQWAALRAETGANN